MMEARTGEKFTYQQMMDFYNGKPMNVRRMEMPDGVQKDKAVKFDKEKQDFSFSAIRQERKKDCGYDGWMVNRLRCGSAPFFRVELV